MKSMRTDKCPHVFYNRRAHPSPATLRSKESQMKKPTNAAAHRAAPLHTPTDLKAAATKDLSGALNMLLADYFALYLKTKNFHWHMSGPHFRDYHLLLDEQGEQIFDMTDDIAERARKIGGTSIHSIGEIAKQQRLADNNEEFVSARKMLAELSVDNQQLTRFLRATH